MKLYYYCRKHELICLFNETLLLLLQRSFQEGLFYRFVRVDFGFAGATYHLSLSLTTITAERERERERERELTLV